MAYASLLEEETVTSNYLAVLKPRRRVTGFTLFSGSVYVADFDFYGEVTRCWEDDLELSLGTSSSLSADQFYYDFAEKKLYVRLNPSADPDLINIIAEFEIYCGTIDAHFYRDPTDDTTRVVYFEPIINKSPVFKKSSTDSLSGFNPVQTSSISLINAEHIFEKCLYDSSFVNASIDVYHWLDDLEVANIKRVLNGYMQNVSIDRSIITIKVFDGIDILSNEYRHSIGSNFYDSTTFPTLNPQYIGKPIRKVYGFVDGFIPVNSEYVDESPINTDNRTWIVTSGQDGLSDVTKTVIASPSSTTTRTYLNSVTGLQVGDTVWFDKATDDYGIIEAVGANYIDHSAIGVAATTGELVKRAFVPRVTIVQNDVEYVALYKRDYTVSNLLPGETSGFIFDINLETNLSMPEALNANDQVFCRVYGRVNDITLGGPAYGADDSRTLSMMHPAQVVLDFLKNSLGFSDSEIDSTSFTDALTDISSGIGFAIPSSNSDSSFPKYRDILGDILKCCFAKLIVNNDGKWALSVRKPLGSVTKTIADDEIIFNSIRFDFEFDEIFSEIIVQYAKEESSFASLNQETYAQVVATSDTAKYLHKVSKSKTETSLWAFVDEAEEMATRLSYVFGDRSGTASIQTKNRFFDTELGDNIEIERTSVPGFEYDGENLYNRELLTIEIEKSKQTITIKLDDQKGIEDNAGGW